jgi:hypothetical protein
MERPGADLIAHYLDPDRHPAQKRWSRKHAHTQRGLCERFAAPVVIGNADLDLGSGDRGDVPEHCRCHADPPRLHGPYAEWTRKIGGKTVTRRLTPAELTAWQPLFDNAKKIRALLAELQDLTLQLIEASPDQNNDT